MRFARMFAAALLFTVLPVATFAQTTNSSNISALLSEITALEQQIATLTGTSTSAASATSNPNTVNPTTCPTLDRSLSIGANGSDVASLQTFLAQQGFFAAQPTGYFGSVTQAAVSAWQLSKGVLPQGSTSADGLGTVGPKTSVAIAQACGGPASTAPTRCSVVLPPNTECSTGWQPVPDQNGCTMYYECAVELPATSSVPTVAPTTPVSTTSCPVVVQPTCSGNIVPFQTGQNGCIESYECVL